MRTTLLLVACISLFVAIGCKSKNEKTTTTREEFNRERFAAAPAVVADGFMRDYPDTTATHVRKYDTGSRGTIYGVNFIRGTKIKFASYTESGQRISPPVPPKM